MTFFPRCPDGHRWYACRHEELRQPLIGKLLVIVGAATIGMGIIELTRGF